MVNGDITFGSATMRCVECQKEFDWEIPAVIVGSKDLDFLKKFFDYSAFFIKCSHCGCERASVYQFIFYDIETNCIYYVIPDEKMLRFEAIRILLDDVLYRYVKTANIDVQKSLRVAKKYYVPMKSFHSALFGGEDGYTTGTLHITPQPSIEINDSFEFVGEIINYNISKNNVLLVENNIPEHLETLVYHICEMTKYFGFPLKANKIEDERKANTTKGIPEIVIILGSNVVLPILLGVAANLISDWLKKTKKNKSKEKPENEVIKFVFKINDTDKVYVFTGHMRDLIKTFGTISTEAISSLKINGVSHIATTVGDIILDCYTEKLFTFQEASDYYSQKFNRNSSVEYNLYQETNDYALESTRVCTIAAKLMASEKYKSALDVLKPLIINIQPPNIPSSQLLYNYAQCLFHLGRKEEAINSLTQIIQQYLQLPSIDDMEYFKTGCTTREDFDRSTSIVLEKIKYLKSIQSHDSPEFQDFLRTTEYITDTQIYAWIFLSVSEHPAPLPYIIAVADKIKHAIPSLKDLQTSFGWLQAQKLVRKEGNEYLLTDTGNALYKSISNGNILDTIAEKFSKLPTIDFQLDDITEAELDNAYKFYSTKMKEIIREMRKEKNFMWRIFNNIKRMIIKE